MNSVYESLRALLRTKELEIKKLEKEIEALRIVLPIVAEAGTNGADPEATANVMKFASEAAASNVKPFTPNDFEAVVKQSAAAGGTTPAHIPAPDLTPKPRTNWP